MLGLMLILVYGVFLLVIPAVLGLFVWRWAIKRGKRRAWSWGMAAALAIPVWAFWDYYPTKWTHEYYCKKEAGFWIYKTLEQWKVENPGEIEKLTSSRLSPSIHRDEWFDHTTTLFLNQRFNRVIKKTGSLPLNRWRWEQTVTDSKTNEVLARSVDFSTNYGEFSGGNISPKFWLRRDHCVDGAINQSSLSEFAGDAKEINHQREKK